MSAPSAPARAASPVPPLPPLARKRTASVDMTDSAPKPSATAHVKGHRRTASVAAPHRSGLTRDNDGPSLMSIVEGVSKQNRDAWAHQDPDRMLVLPKAPPPANVSIDLDAIPRATAGPSQPRVPSRRSSPLLNHSQMSASASAPSLPATASRPPVKMPLRSALRNSSRTPSPNPPLPASSGSLSAALNGATPAKTTAAPSNISHTLIVPDLKKDDDAISVSSYETGHEELDDHEPEPAPPPPPQEEKPHGLGGSDLSQSTSSTMMTGAAPTRRKSVRMSLPPTFSVTPPAIDDDDSPRGRHSPWSSKTAERPAMYTGPTGWSSRVPDHRQRDMWEDSSDEDEGYSAARRLLSRM
ncbi:hypothetical protein WOLCODRAFT_139621 [Wolfiporia cocos MD-104 SS10]|uniref:Uncharacterized protein n=1 Tax=Wolfiporia cocos (strain MD-104) TaxID=742152 RepID=A0A2H3J4Z3_WOLCO|nr:hypothetical protein WOLCODRAFT_139621 [Wolfiporia cocos MD-104 SS10]